MLRRRTDSANPTVGDASPVESSTADTDSSPQHPAHGTASIPPFIIKAVTIASLGGILFGYDLGVVSGALPQVAAALSLSQKKQEMVVSFLYLGGGLGAAVGGSLCDTTGRRSAILLTDAIFLMGAAILYWSWSLTSVLVGRIVIGFAVSVSGIADVSYLHEIAPIEWRGAVVSVNEACISLGFLLAYTAGYGINLVDPVDGWRAMFGLSGIIAIVQFIGMLAMPESPVWLRECGLIEEADEALKTIRGGEGWCGGKASADTDMETETKSDTLSDFETSQPLPVPASIKDDVLDYAAINDQQSPSTVSVVPLAIQSSSSSINLDGNRSFASTVSLWLSSILANYTQFRHEIAIHHRQAFVAVFLAVSQQFCGHTNVLNYAPEIFRQIGVESTLGTTLLIGVLKFVVTCFVIFRIEFLGRRPLLLGGLLTISTSLFLLSVAFVGNDGDDPMGPATSSVALVGMFGVVLGYAASFGPLTWLLTSEMFPTSVRGRALGASTIITYLSAALVSFTFLTGQTLFGPSVPFSIYCVITLISLGFAFLAIPDTGERTPAEIEEEMKTMKWWSWRESGVSLWGRKESQTNLLNRNAEERPGSGPIRRIV